MSCAGSCVRIVGKWLQLLVVKTVQPKERRKSQRKTEKGEKRPVNREHGDKNRRTDKNSINFCDSVFPRGRHLPFQFSILGTRI